MGATIIICDWGLLAQQLVQMDTESNDNSLEIKGWMYNIDETSSAISKSLYKIIRHVSLSVFIEYLFANLSKE